MCSERRDAVPSRQEADYNVESSDAGRHALAMPLYTTDALILRTYQLGEADRIVVFLTSDRGKKRGVANGARRLKSRFTGGLEPLTRVRLAYFERERRDLVRLRYVEPVRSPLMVRDGAALGHVEYFAELIDECAPEADPNATLYRLGAAVVDSLIGEIPLERLARYFEYWVLRPARGLSVAADLSTLRRRPGGRWAGGPGRWRVHMRGMRDWRGDRALERVGAVPPRGGRHGSRAARRHRATRGSGTGAGAGASTADRGASGEGAAVREGASSDDRMRLEKRVAVARGRYPNVQLGAAGEAVQRVF